MLKALIFDVDGTLADTEDIHRQAFNLAFAEAGLDWHWDRALYARLLDVAGGKERIGHYWRLVGPGSGEIDGRIDAIHASKTRHYDALAGAGRLPLRPGIRALIDEAVASGLPIAIATTTTPANIDALLRHHLGSAWPSLFAAVRDGATPGAKKPAPDIYLDVLEVLGLDGADCIALEDSENGLRAAAAAGIPAVITPTAYTAHHDFGDALITPVSLAGVNLATMRRWHAAALQP